MRTRMTAPAGPALAVLVALATVAEAQPATFLAFDSQPGDYVGQGRRFTLTPADGTIQVRTYLDGNIVQVAFDGAYNWDLYFAAPDGATVTPGIYEGATRHPFQSPTRPGLDVSGEFRGCGKLTGRFVVLEAVYDSSGNLQQFAADYEQHCRGEPPLFGSVRYASAVPLGPRLSASRSSVYERDDGTTTLEIVVSLSAPAASPVTVHYRSKDGTATEGADYVAVSGTIVIPPGQTAATVPVVVIGDDEVEGDETFFLVLEGAQGAPLAFGTGVGTIVDDDPYKTFLLFDSQSGDWVGGGERFTVTPVDGHITATRNSAGGIQVKFDGSTWWYLEFVAPHGATITPGMYEGAARWLFPTPVEPGLDVHGDGRGCNSLSGRFVVLEAVYDDLGNVEQFAADYEQHCEKGKPTLFGSVRFNSSAPVGPRLSVSTQEVYEGDFGRTARKFVVSLSAPASEQVLVRYRTEDGTATAGVDYVAVSGAIVIPPGETAMAVPMTVIADGDAEGDETFSIVLEDVLGAPLAFGVGLSTIVDDDPDKTLLVVDSQPGDGIGVDGKSRTPRRTQPCRPPETSTTASPSPSRE